MDRMKYAGNIINKMQEINTVLDVGCRQCDLKKFISSKIRYYGNDLFQNKVNSVDYVGDITDLIINEKFDLVVALDILEHVEQPSIVFDKLLYLSNSALIISLPNCYDLKGKFKFLFKGRLGGKYMFSANETKDRHRWIMSRAEIVSFYQTKIQQHSINSGYFCDMKYGDLGGNFASRIRAVTRILPTNLCTETVFGVFVK